LSTDAVAPEAPAPVDGGAERAAERDTARRACVVRLGGRPFAVDVAQAREVITLDVTTSVPGAPAPLVGVMNLRGNVLPVVEARPLLGLPIHATAGRPRALIVADGEQRAAILIEEVVGLTVLAATPPAPEVEGDTAGGAVGGDTGEAATVLDARAVLAAARRAWNSALGGERA
jgi:purine-binding chemotaxis protein CheW